MFWLFCRRSTFNNACSLFSAMRLTIVFVLIGVVSADALPKGNCQAPAASSDLRHCSFKGRTLVKADLHGSDLSDVNFENARMSFCDLSGARLIGANFKWAMLKRCKMRRVDLRNADLFHANLDGT